MLARVYLFAWRASFSQSLLVGSHELVAVKIDDRFSHVVRLIDNNPPPTTPISCYHIRQIQFD